MSNGEFTGPQARIRQVFEPRARAAGLAPRGYVRCPGRDRQRLIGGLVCFVVMSRGEPFVPTLAPVVGAQSGQSAAADCPDCYENEESGSQDEKQRKPRISTFRGIMSD
jgi:hypothetical protein